MSIWEKLKAWLTDEQYSEVEDSKEELKTEPIVVEDSVKTETNTEVSTTTQDESKVTTAETVPNEPETETEPVLEGDKPVVNEKQEEVSVGDVESQALPVILEDGWLNDSGEVDLEKVKDEKLKGYIDNLIKKSNVIENQEHGFNPTAPITSAGYTPGMSFEDALGLEYKN